MNYEQNEEMNAIDRRQDAENKYDEKVKRTKKIKKYRKRSKKLLRENRKLKSKVKQLKEINSGLKEQLDETVKRNGNTRSRLVPLKQELLFERYLAGINPYADLDLLSGWRKKQKKKIHKMSDLERVLQLMNRGREISGPNLYQRPKEVVDGECREV